MSFPLNLCPALRWYLHFVTRKRTTELYQVIYTIQTDRRVLFHFTRMIGTLHLLGPGAVRTRPFTTSS